MLLIAVKLMYLIVFLFNASAFCDFDFLCNNSYRILVCEFFFSTLSY